MRLTSSVLSALSTTFAFVGCGSNPSSPDVEFTPSTTIHNQLERSHASRTFRGNASTLRASRSGAEDGLTVMIFDRDGNEITTVDVVNGQFTVRGLCPKSSGRVHGRHHPRGPGVLRRSQPNQELDLTLSYENGTVSVIETKRTGVNHEPGNGIELQGAAPISSKTAPSRGAARSSSTATMSAFASGKLRYAKGAMLSS